jgi:predicted outer membrane protein
MKKTFIAAGLAGIATLSIAYAQEDSTTRKPVDQSSNSQPAAHGQHHQQAVTVEEALLKKLQKGNEGEIELAKVAQQHSSNQAVKDLAQHLITDHQNMIQNLKKVQASVSHDHASTKPANPTAPGARNAATTAAQSENSRDMMGVVPHELCQVADKACENNLAMTKEMLSQYKGQDFDMAFLGQQCVAHMMTLAELKAIESDGPQELRQTATEAAAKVKEHLNMIKELSSKLEDDRKAPNS